MKKFFIITLLAFLGINAHAQYSNHNQGDMAVGGYLSYGSRTVADYNSFGIGAKFQYNVTSPFRLEAAASYFLEKDNINIYDLSLNAHYLFDVADGVTVYPLGGITFLKAEWEKSSSFGGHKYFDSVSVSEEEIGINLGAGIEFALDDSFNINAEAKYQFADNLKGIVVSIGFGYRF